MCGVRIRSIVQNSLQIPIVLSSTQDNALNASPQLPFGQVTDLRNLLDKVTWRRTPGFRRCTILCVAYCTGSGVEGWKRFGLRDLSAPGQGFWQDAQAGDTATGYVDMGWVAWTNKL